MSIFWPLAAQNIPIGTWRTHAAYRSAQTLAVAGTQVYAAAPGSLFVHDTQAQQATPLSRLDGFTATDVSRLAYAPETQTLAVAYESGIIDLLQGRNLFTITAIAEANLEPDDKRNRHILVAGQTAYLAYGFGVAVIDLAARRIRATYRNLGPGGTPLAVNGTALLDDRIFLATERGVLFAPRTGTNLLDFAAWRTVPPADGVPGGAATHIAAFGGTVYAAFGTNGLYRLEANSRWTPVTALPVGEVLFLQTSGQRLLTGYTSRIIVLENQNITVVTHPLIRQPRQAEHDAAGRLWVADAVNGLVGGEAGNFRNFAPNGPVTNLFRRLARWQSDVVALSGGFDPNFAPRRDSSGFSVFTATGWQNYTAASQEPTLRTPNVLDFAAAAQNPLSGEQYAASFGNGLVARETGGNWRLLNEPNAPPRDALVTGLATDTSGTLWVAVYGAAFGRPSLYGRTANGAWRGFVFDNFSARQPTSLLADASGPLWMPSAAGGVWVFDPAANRGRLLTAANGSGGLPDNRVLAVAQDVQGQVWVGTGRGAAYFFSPAEVLENQPVDAIAPIFEGRPLLRDEAVTTIRTDGGNRKWFGTRNGAWLFDADLTRQITHFTVRNSPLLSDEILDLEIQPATGEVFFATSAGLVSFRGDATEATPQHGEVQVFPNPVRPGFDGLVGVSGLAANATVKITDAAGRLVLQTRANGGTATWNLRDYTGRRVVPGVYLVFSATDDGTERFVTKVAVLSGN